MVTPNVQFQSRDGQTLRSGLVVDGAGVPTLVTSDSNGQQVLTPIGASGGGGVPSAEAADRALVAADNGKNLICSGSRSFAVGSGLGVSFGVSAKGAVTFTGAGVNDVRTTGATSPWCALMATGLDTYDVVGSKA